MAVSSSSPRGLIRCWARGSRMVLTGPVFVGAVILAVHIAGRVMSFCAPYRGDSFVYAVNAYRLWQPDATVEDVIPDKPPGQALLTGWCFRVAPGPPSRLTLVPIESVFLLSAYAVFWRLVGRLFGRPYAGVLTLMFALAQNTYTALESTNDGFNSSETYMLLPMLVAVYAHLTIGSPVRRGLLRGIGVGIALTIKQSAAGLVLVLLFHGLAEVVAHRRIRPTALDLTLTLLGVALAIAPVVTLLHVRGWLFVHLSDLTEFSGKHVGAVSLGIPPWYELLPLVPVVWWVLLGGLGWVIARSAEPGSARPATDVIPVLAIPWRSAYGLAWLWFVVEAVVLASLTKPATHYYQMIVTPAVLLAGFGISRFAGSLSQQIMRTQVRAWRWVGVTTTALLVTAAMPVLGSAARHSHSFDRAEGEKAFAAWLESWPSHGTSDALRKTLRHAELHDSESP